MTSTTAAAPHRADVDDLYARLAALAGVDAATDPLGALRRTMAGLGTIAGETDLSGVEIVEVDAGGVPAEWVVAEHSAPEHRIVHLHGGGFTAGAPKDYRPMTATLARLSGASILAVDYRLAPEHPFPAGLDDATAALAWAAVTAPSGEARPATTLTLTGDSAGGNLAAAATLEALRLRQRTPDRLGLLSPLLDLAPDPARVGTYDFLVSPETIAFNLSLYISDATPVSDPRVSPLVAETAALAQFPPTLVHASTVEALLVDARRFTERLQDAGARVTLSAWPELPHAWHAVPGLIPEARDALRELAAFATA